MVTPERQTSSNKHLCTNLPQCNRKSFLTPQPNKTKPPLQVLAVVEGNSEKNKVWDGTRDGAINYIKFYLYSITHSVILISYRRLGWSLLTKPKMAAYTPPKPNLITQSKPWLAGLALASGIQSQAKANSRP